VLQSVLGIEQPGSVRDYHLDAVGRVYADDAIPC
jgi:hypothetical protein